MEKNTKELEKYYDPEEIKKRDIASYRKHALLNDDVIITKEMLDKEALTAACVERNCDIDQMLESLFGKK